MIKKTNRKLEREKRHARVRNKVSGTAERPRLCIYKSNTNIYAQIIDDVAGNTLVQASTLDKEVKTKYANKAAAKDFQHSSFLSAAHIFPGNDLQRLAPNWRIHHHSRDLHFHRSRGP